MLNYLLFNQTTQQTNPLVSLLPLIIMFVALYLLFILPQQKAEKKHKEMLKSLNKGDRVILSSGIIGTITNIKEDIIFLEISPKVEIKVLKTTVTRKIEDDSEVKNG
ncbi:MAG: preprotein translocase subunit YajC [bacterium]|uniref:Preprotein translocase subunit YajC n=2 Tax=Bacteria candidate phyla TaxID=1783234 RepID=A0A348ML05_UNCW3|nr:MAG: Putative preprotein translocase, subunit YajC [candidate division TA06 bacterium 32_111]KUK86631.1 MAG: Putative preprotein translocase, subunit YajC [candidate division TA06 bacterium 34_109]MDI6699881.1 preprotein translocase subunit YajC [bacterium]HAF07731.1 preprotein translocase subunit YajC [candidate division WOR-3 bacterium]HCP17194.1 preprotein translocase subunit YajC [candidate division WOR-3 bacterium]